MTVWWLLYFYSVILRNDILIENNKFGCIIMQNNEVMEILFWLHSCTNGWNQVLFPLAVRGTWLQLLFQGNLFYICSRWCSVICCKCTMYLWHVLVSVVGWWWCQCVCVCELNYHFLAHLMQQPRFITLNMSNPVNESAYMELRSDYLSNTSPTAVVDSHNKVCMCDDNDVYTLNCTWLN